MVSQSRSPEAFGKYWSEKVRVGEVSSLDRLEELAIRIFIRWLLENHTVLRKSNLDINTPLGLLKHLLHVNQHGVVLIGVTDGYYYPLPQWMWGHCKRALGLIE